MSNKQGSMHLTLGALAAQIAARQVDPVKMLGRDYDRPRPNPILRAGASIARCNRWTGQPHEHRREIARRQRQRERQAAKLIGNIIHQLHRIGTKASEMAASGDLPRRGPTEAVICGADFDGREDA